MSHYPTPGAPTSKDAKSQSQSLYIYLTLSYAPEYHANSAPPPPTETLLLIDTLNPLSTTAPRHLTPFLSSLLIHPTISLMATYHIDVPLPLPPTVLTEYEPHPLTTLNHLATAILRVSSLYQAVQRRRAQDRSLPEPDFGLDEGREGVLIGIKEGGLRGDGLVVEMELRRRSGRAVVERFVLVPKVGATGTLSLLSDHPLFAAPEDAAGGNTEEDDELAETTFSLGLTEKQRKDRDGIVLPYFDAQEDVGGGEGGRILYEMGREDDFDDEEDEI